MCFCTVIKLHLHRKLIPTTTLPQRKYVSPFDAFDIQKSMRREPQHHSRLLSIFVTISPGVSFALSPRSRFLLGVSTHSSSLAYCRAQFFVEYQSGGLLASLVNVLMFRRTATLKSMLRLVMGISLNLWFSHQPNPSSFSGTA